jgi:hypothetical protein
MAKASNLLSINMKAKAISNFTDTASQANEHNNLVDRTSASNMGTLHNMFQMAGTSVNYYSQLSFASLNSSDILHDLSQKCIL